MLGGNETNIDTSMAVASHVRRAKQLLVKSPDAFTPESLSFYGVDTSVEAGSTNVHMVPLRSVNSLTQIRQEYDADDLKELMDSIKMTMRDGKIYLELLNPPMLNLLDKDLCGTYLDDHYDFYAGKAPRLGVEDLVGDDNQYAILVNGHRRDLAVALKCLTELGIDPETTDVFVSHRVEYNLTFEEALPSQCRENTYRAIRPVEDAEAIERTHLWFKRRGIENTTRPLMDLFGCKEGKIQDALMFVSAPEYIKDFVGRKRGLSYTNVVDLVRLRKAEDNRLQQRYGQEFLEECEVIEGDELAMAAKRHMERMSGVPDEATAFMRDYFERTIKERLHGKKSSYISGLIDAKIKEITHQASYQTGELFIIDEELEKSRGRDATRKEIGILAVSVIRYLHSNGSLSEELRDQLRPIVGEPTIDEEAASLMLVDTEQTATMF